jgi:hypothetical protein
VVHGDFRGVNLLVADDDGRILGESFCGFGRNFILNVVPVTGYGVMTAVEKNQELGFPQWSLQWGDARWMAPGMLFYLYICHAYVFTSFDF